MQDLIPPVMQVHLLTQQSRRRCCQRLQQSSVACRRISDYQRRRVYRHLRRQRSSRRPRRRHTWSQHQAPQASPFAQAAGPLDEQEQGCGSPQEHRADAEEGSTFEG